MNTFLLLSIIAGIIYWAYTISVFCLFGVPESYSNTFYLFNQKKKGLGILFPFMCVIFVFLLIPSWFHLSDILAPNITFLAFIAGAGLLLVAAAPFFKEKQRDTGHKLKDLIYKSFHGQGLVHTIGALLAMICSVTWMCLTGSWFFVIAWLLITLFAMFSTMSYKNSITFWGEFWIFNMILFFNILYNIVY